MFTKCLHNLGDYYKYKIYDQCQCYPMCERVSYTAAVSQAYYPAQHILTYLEQTYGQSKEYLR